MLLNKSIKVAFCGVISALCVALMFLTWIIPIATYALPAIAGALLIAVVVEIGARWAWACWGVVSVLSLMLTGDKEAALLFFLFFGWYPIVKSMLDQKKPRWLSWMLKFAAFNAAVVICFFAATAFLGLKAEEFVLFGVYLPWVFLLLANLVFLLYDRALAGLVGFYFMRLHQRVGRLLKNK